jgi:hypothetical protein
MDNIRIDDVIIYSFNPAMRKPIVSFNGNPISLTEVRRPKTEVKKAILK